MEGHIFGILRYFAKKTIVAILKVKCKTVFLLLLFVFVVVVVFFFFWQFFLFSLFLTL